MTLNLKNFWVDRQLFQALTFRLSIGIPYFMFGIVGQLLPYALHTKMFFIKVLLHQILFLLSFVGVHYYFDLNIYFTILTLIHVYVASYFVSLWAIKFVFLFPCTKVKPENKCVFITGNVVVLLECKMCNLYDTVVKHQHIKTLWSV